MKTVYTQGDLMALLGKHASDARREPYAAALAALRPDYITYRSRRKLYSEAQARAFAAAVRG